MLQERKIPDDDTPALGEAAQHVLNGLRRGTLEPFWLLCGMICIDLPLFSLGFWFAQYTSTSVARFEPVISGGIAILGAGLFAILMLATGSYRSSVLSNRRQFVLRSLACAVVPGLGLLWLVGGDASTGVVSAFFSCVVITVLSTRLGIQLVVQWAVETRLIARRAVIAGGGPEAEQLIRGLAARDNSDVRLIGIFDDRDDTRSAIQVLGVPKLGGYTDLIPFSRASEIDLVIIALPLAAEERIEWLLQQFRVLPFEVRLAAYSDDYTFSPSSPNVSARGNARSFAPGRRLAKRAFDLLFTSIALALLWPVMAGAALAVRLDSPGPVFFSQRRHGYNHQEIKVLKFRSMYHEMSDPTARQIVTRDDPRVTRVGRFLRRSSIDELPQLFNVLRGDLSLVGPRPHAVNAQSSQNVRFTKIVDGYAARHRLPPGITGWAQVNGLRGEVDEPRKLVQRFEHDLFYIENWSLWLDLKILFRTPLALLKSNGAY
jgi:Undecaprenyl-phosphate glucose phosphotransferase